jgi:hypothetical protein
MTAGVSLEWRKRRKSALAPAGALTGSSHEFLQVDRSLSRQRPRGSSTPPSIFISSAGTTEREKSCFCLFLSDTVRSVGVLTLIVRRQEIGVPNPHPPFSQPIFSPVGVHTVLTGSLFPKRFRAEQCNVMATRSRVDLRQISAGRFVLPCLAPFWLQYERQKQAGS